MATLVEALRASHSLTAMDIMNITRQAITLNSVINMVGILIQLMCQIDQIIAFGCICKYFSDGGH